MFEDRPYQVAAKESVSDGLRAGVRQQLIQMATGTGKTIVFAKLYEHLKSLIPGKMLVLAHREELIDQLAAVIARAVKVLPHSHEPGQPQPVKKCRCCNMLTALRAATSHQEARRHDQHSLVIDSLRDLRAHCSCGRWNLSCITSDAEPATQIRAHAADAHRLHVEGVRRA